MSQVKRVPKDKTLPLKYWQGVVELPSYNGDRRRKFVRSKDRREAIRKLNEAIAEKARSGGDLPTRDTTVADWIEYWFAEICTPKNRPKTRHTYRGLIDREILPVIGKINLTKLTPADVRRMCNNVTGKGLSSTTAVQVHRILAVALKYAVREGKVGRNVATMIDPPVKAVPQLTALTVPESIQVLQTAAGDRLGSLWAAVLLTGARQGELLGLEINRVTDVLDLSWQLQRITWEHGCETPCGGKRGADCPNRKVNVPANFEHRKIAGGLYWTRPKSRAGWRNILLVDPLRTIIERRIEAAANEPNPHGLLWTREDGSPIDPRWESEQWDELLKRAGVTDVRLHDGRHTTVDLLLEAGVPEDLVQEIVGHSDRAMTRAYKTRGNRARHTQAMEQLSALISQPVDSRSGTRAVSDR